KLQSKRAFSGASGRKILACRPILRVFGQDRCRHRSSPASHEHGAFVSLAARRPVVANVALEFIARWRNPPIGEFLDVNNVRLHFIMRGDPDAPPLVMFHGNGTMLQDFAISGLVDKAASKFRVICFDRPGFGHSSRPRSVIWSPERQADLFAAALARLGIERTLVLGHSWGTLVARALPARNGGLG